MNSIKTFSELREYLWDERQCCVDMLLERLEELDDFQCGMYRGEILAYDTLLDQLRLLLKHGDVE